jgi:hypothetical protein
MIRWNAGRDRLASLGKRHRCLATSSLELLAALTLLTSALTFMLPLVVRHGRVLVSARHYRLVLDELSNQLDVLTSLPDNEVALALDRLEPSAFVSTKVPGFELSGQTDQVDPGTRILLRAVWNECGRRDASISMAGWIFPGAWQPTVETVKGDGP